MFRSLKILFCLVLILMVLSFRGAYGADDQQELKGVEDDLNVLKEEIFRSKARTLLLQEFLINTEVQVYFKNKSQKHYRLKSALCILDHTEIYKKEFAAGQEPSSKKDELLFSGVTTPGRHEISMVLVYEGEKTGGYTEKDYEYQVTGDYSFLAVRGETTVVTLSAIDHGNISKNTDIKASQYQIDLNLKVESDRLAQRRRRIEKRTVGLALNTGWLFESYQLVSNQLNIRQQQASFIPLGVRAHWWFTEHFGVEGYYHYAAWSAKTGFNGQKVDMTMSWFGIDGKLRYHFTRSITSPVIIVNLGYNFFETKPDQLTSPLVRLSDKYAYLDVGLEGKIPFTSSLGMQAKALFFPYVDLSESPVTSGRHSNTKGFDLEGGFYWNFWRDFSVDLNYMFMIFDNDFTGTATRTSPTGQTLSVVQSRAIYQGVVLGLKYEF